MSLAMLPTDLPEFVEHFRQRVLQDALAEATATYWRRRAQTFLAAMPRPGDYTGQATPQEIEARRERIAAAARACAERAELAIGGDLNG